MMKRRLICIIAVGSAPLVAALWWLGSGGQMASLPAGAHAPEAVSSAKLSDGSVSQPARLAQERLNQELSENPLADCIYREFLTDAPVLMESSNYAAAPNARERVIGKKLHRIDDFKYPLILSTEKDVRAKDGSWHRQRSVVVADHLIVKLEAFATKKDLEALCDQHESRVRRKMLTKDCYLVEFKANHPDTLNAKKQAFSQERIIKWAEADPVGTTTATPNDPFYGNLWGMHNTGQSGGSNDADIDAPEAWDITTGSSDILVAVIDTGIDYTHPDLVDNIWTNSGEIPNNGIDDDGNGFIDDVHGWDFYNNDNDPMDDRHHGTHCAGTLGATGNNGTGVVGVCWDVSIAGLKWMGADGRGVASDAADSISYTTKIGVRLTSNSWGSGPDFSQVLHDAIEEARDNDILFVAAAGNSATDLDVGIAYPSSFDLDNIVNVLSTDQIDGKVSTSSYGLNTVHLGAPGDGIFSTVPVGTQFPFGTYDYYGLTGTSMACPHVAGAAALLLSVAPNLTYRELKQVLIDSTDPSSYLTDKCISGGRLNVFNALNSLGLSNRLELPIDDDSLDGTVGNSDGYINPGETIALNTSVENSSIGSSFANVAGTLSLASADSYVTINSGTHYFGTLEMQEQQTASYVLQIAPGTPTPHSFSVVHTLTADGVDPKVETWDFTVYTSSTISGTVSEAGVPLTGATVSYDGPVKGSATSASDGSYSITVVNGTYSLIASFSGLIPSDPQTVTVPVSQAGIDFDIGAPQITINPSSLALTLPDGGTSSETLTIRNDGSLDLNWYLFAGEYSLSRSGDVGGPVYQWIDIAATGTPITLGDDENSGALPIGFEFPFYGQSFSNLNVCSNGWISFTSNDSERFNWSLPNPKAPENMIALFWDDMDPSASGQILYQLVDPHTYVLQFEAVPLWGSSVNLLTAQIVLKSDGRIFLNYKEMQYTGGSTVGIQNADGSEGVLAQHFESFDANETTMLFEANYPWIQASLASGIIQAGQSMDITVTLDASLAPDELNQTQLKFINNTVFQPTFSVPVALTVGDGSDLPTVYAAWSTETFANAFSDNALNSNGDGDWMTNLMEFAFGTDPTLADGGTLTVDGSINGGPISQEESGTMHFYFVRRTDHATSGSVGYTVQFSPDLSTFTNSSATPEKVADSAARADYELVKVPYPNGSRFGRLVIDVVP